MKQFYSTILLFLIAITSYAHDVEIDGIYYNLIPKAREAIVTGYNYGSFNEYSGSITIPTTITVDNTTYSVTTIGDYAFDGCVDLTSITIPNSVTTIGRGAFANCRGLTSITVDKENPNYCSEDNVIYTKDKSALIYCMSSMQGDFTIPNSVTTIGDSAFSYCFDLTSVTIPNSVTKIGRSAFYFCRSLASITIGNSVTIIDEYAFRYCYGLTSVTIPNSVTNIEWSAFANCM